MTCENDWTFRFVERDEGNDPIMEIRPYTMDYKMGRDKLSFARAKFDSEVGDMMQPHTRDPSGKLHDPKLVEVFYDGELVNNLYFTTDNVRYGNNYTHIEFEDPQYSLADGVIDLDAGSTTIGSSYEYAFEKRLDKKTLKGIKFQLQDEYLYELNNIHSYAQGDVEDRSDRGKAYGIVLEERSRIDMEKISPLQAIWQLNDFIGITSWVGPEKYLWVGVPEGSKNAQYHIAAPDDDRVWRYNPSEVQIRHPRKPIKKVVVEGALVDEEGMGGLDDTVSFFNPWSEDGMWNAGDMQIIGEAVRTDIDYGETLTLDSKKA